MVVVMIRVNPFVSFVTLVNNTFELFSGENDDLVVRDDFFKFSDFGKSTETFWDTCFLV